MLALMLVPTGADALAAVAPPARTPELGTVQVTATHSARPARPVPATISVVEGDALQRPSLGVNLSERLQDVPGVLARERQNYAQDLQLSIRGFGARASFGIRGIRLLVDGIPATMPDGQGQVSNINLASAGRIEVLRGPFSALYGNAAGGVIQVFTAEGAAEPGARLGLAGGSDGAQRESLGFRGAGGGLDFVFDATHFRTNGYREHGAAERSGLNARLKFEAGDTRGLLLANGLEAPESQDPLGLTAAQMAADPRQSTAAARQFDTRKSLRHQQIGAVLEREMAGGGALRLQMHAGSRRVLQFLAVPVAAQASPLSGGGVVDLDSDFNGVDARWTGALKLAGRPLELVFGIDLDRQRQHRLGFENFAGASTGVRGRLRRDQLDLVANSDPYLQATWQFSDATLLMLGLRHSRVHFRSDDRYLSAGNPDDSGRITFSATTPVFGASHAIGSRWTVYAAAGGGFETPTFDELGYRPDGSAGLNFALLPTRTRSIEAGARANFAKDARVEVAMFRADSDDELAVASNSGGRSSYRNIGRARRQGLELFADLPLGGGWRATFAGTWMDAHTRDSYLACAGAPCNAPTVAVAAGAGIPGVPRHFWSLAADRDFGSRWELHLGARGVSSLLVDNARPLRAAGYVVCDASATRRLPSLGQGARAFWRIDNAFDRRYSGSVIVNEGNGRYFEPAPGRAFLVGVDLRW